jgi:GNAT superfamily N-acetyltransferase
MPSSLIRPAAPSDIGTILRFVRELAEYEREPDAVVASEASLHESLFGPGAVARAVIAEDAGTPLGFAVYFFNFSTWLGRPGLYLEDLYVTPDARGRGIGKQLLSHLAQIAVGQGCGRMEWAVLDWNEPAIQFYRAAGAVPMEEWTVYRLTGDTLTQFAESGRAVREE